MVFGWFQSYGSTKEEKVSVLELRTVENRFQSDQTSPKTKQKNEDMSVPEALTVWHSFFYLKSIYNGNEI